MVATDRNGRLMYAIVADWLERLGGKEPLPKGVKNLDPDLRDKRDRGPSGALGLRPRITPPARKRAGGDESRDAEPTLIAEVFDQTYGLSWSDVKPYFRTRLARMTQGISGQDGRVILEQVLQDLSGRELDASGKPITDRVKYLVASLASRLEAF